MWIHWVSIAAIAAASVGAYQEAAAVGFHHASRGIPGAPDRAQGAESHLLPDPAFSEDGLG